MLGDTPVDMPRACPRPIGRERATGTLRLPWTRQEVPRTGGRTIERRVGPG